MYQQYINGKLVDGEGPVLRVENPATGEVVGEFRAASERQALEALESAQRAFKTWSKTSLDERVAWVLKLRDALLNSKDELLELLMLESGKTYSQADGDFQQGIRRLSFMAEEGRRVYGVSFPSYNTAPGEAYHVVEKRPVGVVVAHVAWNFPIGNAALKIGPILVSGCTGVLRPSRETPLTAMKIGIIATELGLPAGVMNIITGSSQTLGPVLNGSDIPRMITLIGSVETGREVMRQGASSIKKYSLELGGNAPVIIMPDADIQKAAKLTVQRKTSNAGQVCICYNRFYVHTSVHEQFCEAVEKELQRVTLGSGKDNGEIVMGPMINRRARDRMLELIREACDQGAQLVCGGTVPNDRQAGNWITPALLVNVSDQMRVAREEIFGPIIAIQKYSDLDDALARANDTPCGLTSYLFGHDTRAVAKAFEGLEFGEVYVNGIPNGVYLPHCGVKQSGVGCDNSFLSLEEYFDFKRFSMIP